MFTVINWSPDWEQLKKASQNGHEIASHTMSHSSLGSLSDEMQTNQLENSQKAINGYIGENKCLTIAYPNCVTGNFDIVKKYYIAARGCQGYIEQSTPSDFMNISSIICGKNGSVKTDTDFISKTDDVISTNGLCVFLIHAIDNDSGYSPLESVVLRQELEYLKKNQSKVWVSTFVNIAKYIKERNSLSISEMSIDKEKIIFKSSCELDQSIYSDPVTIRRMLPKTWNKATVMNDGKEVKSTVVKTNSGNYIMFDIIPNDEMTIKVKK
jgi:oligosaccharide reducing-end xylanase